MKNLLMSSQKLNNFYYEPFEKLGLTFLLMQLPNCCQYIKNIITREKPECKKKRSLCSMEVGHESKKEIPVPYTGYSRRPVT
jgi:hypothetical protein